MMTATIELSSTLLTVLEILGTFTFAISGIRHAAAKHFDWFGGFVCGFAVAIGGGTVRDVMLGVTPFWMLSPLYMICALAAQVFVISSAKYLKRLDNAWFAFDTFGLALFTIAGFEKTVALGHPVWVAVVMGTITGSAGGVIRDVLLNNTPVIFRKELYATVSIAGGLLYWLLMLVGVASELSAVGVFFFIIILRFAAVKYHLTLPKLRDDIKEESD